MPLKLGLKNSFYTSNTFQFTALLKDDYLELKFNYRNQVDNCFERVKLFTLYGYF